MNNKKAKKIRKMLKLKNADLTKTDKIETVHKKWYTRLDGSKHLVNSVSTTVINPIKNAYRKIKKSQK